MANTKDELLEQLQEKFDDLNYRWNIERNKLEAMAQKEGAEAQKKFEEKREEFRAFRKEMKEKMIDLEVAGENAWDDVKDGVENAWKALSASFEKATSHFKK